MAVTKEEEGVIREAPNYIWEQLTMLFFQQYRCTTLGTRVRTVCSKVLQRRGRYLVKGSGQCDLSLEFQFQVFFLKKRENERLNGSKRQSLRPERNTSTEEEERVAMWHHYSANSKCVKHHHVLLRDGDSHGK